MGDEVAKAEQPNWRREQPLIHWRVAFPIADVAKVLGIEEAGVSDLVSGDELPAKVIDGWILIRNPDLIDPDRDPLIAKLQHAWSQAFEWEVDMASDRFPNRPTRQPDGDCSCEGCLTHFRPSERRS